ncbi:thioredoxin family protein [Flavobacterium sp.]|jgi:thioredoxin-related protein|uniref:thioredoxin family protein n=1 Tax=Flavobacterium sp. TaxID=239 RepID=UPI0022C39044|nr:thioredoxin family protein [Flavobacterium sp.]MCZ8145395.1 thioredoxin family protein [Flavobacterium sp.]MCZ8366083.1 thioredoxin family protein [Flavobacterium sp.]
MKKLRCLVLVLATISVGAQEVKTMDEALQKAQAGSHKILLYFSGSDWCAPCIQFKKKFIQAPEFQAFALNNLVVLQVDFPRLQKNKLPLAQEKANESLADQFNPKGIFPLILVLDDQQKILKKWEGLPQESVADFIKALQ